MLETLIVRMTFSKEPKVHHLVSRIIGQEARAQKGSSLQYPLHLDKVV